MRSILIWGGVAIAVFAAIAVFVRHGRHLPRRRVLHAGLLLLFGVVLLIIGFNVSSGAAAVVVKPPPAHHQAHKAKAHTTAVVVCKGSWAVNPYFNNAGHRLLGNGLPPNLTDKTAVLYETDAVKSSAPDMVLLYNAENPELTPVTQAELETSNGLCFSAQGVAAYTSLQNFITAPTTTATTSTIAPGTLAYNSAVANGQGVQYKQSLSGNLRAVVVTGANGARFLILYRCGNIVAIIPLGGIPMTSGPSSSTPITPAGPPSTTTTTTTPHGCIPETVGKDVITVDCTKHCISATACGANGQDSNQPQQHNNPNQVAPTKNYPSGQAETVTSKQAPPADPYKPNPVVGSSPPAVQHSPPGADNGNGAGGGDAGVSHPVGVTNPGGGAAQASSTTIVTDPTTGSTTVVTTGGNPCEDPNAAGCPGT